MTRIVGNVLSRSIIIILTAIAVMGSFSLAAAEPMRTAGLAAEWQGGLSGGKAYYFYPEQTGDPALVAFSDDTWNSPVRADSQKAFSPLGEIGTGNTFFFSQFRKNSKNAVISIKDTILLILRI